MSHTTLCVREIYLQYDVLFCHFIIKTLFCNSGGMVIMVSYRAVYADYRPYSRSYF